VALLLACAFAYTAEKYFIQLPSDVNMWHDIVYSRVDANTPLLLDIDVPKRLLPVPLILWIHGGGCSSRASIMWCCRLFVYVDSVIPKKWFFRYAEIKRIVFFMD
jgi:hypothetical protein